LATVGYLFFVPDSDFFTTARIFQSNSVSAFSDLFDDATTDDRKEAATSNRNQNAFWIWGNFGSLVSR